VHPLVFQVGLPIAEPPTLVSSFPPADSLSCCFLLIVTSVPPLVGHFPRHPNQLRSICPSLSGRTLSEKRSGVTIMQLQSREFVVRPEVSRHVIIKPDPRPFKPVRPVTVPEGGSTLLFLLAALTAMGWAATKRYCHAIGNAAPLPIAR